MISKSFASISAPQTVSVFFLFHSPRYLVGKMDPTKQMAVPIAEVVGFRKMMQICEDVELARSLIPEAIQGSTVCAVTPDGEGITPIVKAERTTIILRDIPSETAVEALKEAFEKQGCGDLTYHAQLHGL